MASLDSSELTSTEPRQISRAELKEILDILVDLPDFDCLPLPPNIHKEFNIPMTGYILKTTEEFLSTHSKRRVMPGSGCETRGPMLDASGVPVIREVASAPPIPVEIVTQMLEEPEATPSLSTEASTTEPPECPADSSSHESDGDSGSSCA